MNFIWTLEKKIFCERNCRIQENFFRFMARKREDVVNDYCINNVQRKFFEVVTYVENYYHKTYINRKIISFFSII